MEGLINFCDNLGLDNHLKLFDKERYEKKLMKRKIDKDIEEKKR